MRSFLYSKTIETLIQFEYSAFEEATVPVCTFVFSNNSIRNKKGCYSGCYGNITVTFFGYNSNGNRGIAAGLGNIQKVKDGEPLGGRARASDEFSALDDDEDFLS